MNIYIVCEQLLSVRNVMRSSNYKILYDLNAEVLPGTQSDKSLHYSFEHDAHPPTLEPHTEVDIVRRL